MPQIISCPCGQSLSVEVPPGGATVQCPRCGTMLQLNIPQTAQSPAVHDSLPIDNPTPPAEANYFSSEPATIDSFSKNFNAEAERSPANGFSDTSTVVLVGAIAVMGLLVIGGGIFVVATKLNGGNAVASASSDVDSEQATPVEQNQFSSAPFAFQEAPSEEAQDIGATSDEIALPSDSFQVHDSSPQMIDDAADDAAKELDPEMAAAQKVAKLFQETLAYSGPRAAEAMVRFDLLIDKAIEGIGIPESQIPMVHSRLSQSLKANSFLTQVKGNGNEISLLRMRKVGGVISALFRVWMHDDGISYFELGFTKSDSDPEINDIYVFNTGDWISDTMHQRLIPVAAGMNGSLAGLPPKHREYLENIEEIRAILLVGNAQPTLALGRMKRLPISVQNEKSMLVYRIKFALASANDREYVSALERFRQQYPDDPSQLLFAVDYHLLKDDIGASISALHALNKHVGGDSALGLLEAGLLVQDGRIPEAISVLRNSIMEDSSFEPAKELLASLERGDSSAVPSRPLMNVEQLNLIEFRATFKTKLLVRKRNGSPVPAPPANIAKRVTYESEVGNLQAYLTNIPSGSNLNPAIIWISGGDCNTIDDGFFRSRPSDNDQTASAFWKSGIVTMYPSLRGGNDNPGFNEGFYGEVNDVLAARNFLSQQRGIDPKRIYLGGHSTGATLVQLVAASTDQFRAVFAFGGVDQIIGYGPDHTPFDTSNTGEFLVRDPIHWMDKVKSPTYIIEGTNDPCNITSLESLASGDVSPSVRFVRAKGHDHFSLLAPLSQTIARAILNDVPNKEFVIDFGL